MAKSFLLNLTDTTFTLAGYGFTVRLENGWSTVEASTEANELPPTLIDRIEESLEFVLGKSVQALVVQEAGVSEIKISIRSPRRLPASSQAMPPLVLALDRPRLTWNLFDCFFSRIVNHKNEGSRPPLSRILQYVFQLRGSAIDAQALALGVAVEGILKEEYSDIAQLTSQTLAEVEAAKDLFKRSALSDSSITPRIVGSIDAMRESRAKDRLLALAEMGVISHSQVKTWSRLRNSTAHAEVHNLDNNFILLCNSVLVLLYCLVFNKIGYRGPFTDYGKPGWPEEIYPVQDGLKNRSFEGARSSRTLFTLEA